MTTKFEIHLQYTFAPFMSSIAPEPGGGIE